MTKFLYKIEKKETEKNIEILLFYLNIDTLETILDIKKILYTITLKYNDFKSLNIESDKIILSKKEIKDKNNEKLIKLEIKSQELYKYLIDKIKTYEFSMYEQDLPIEHKFLIENQYNITENIENKELKLKYLVIDIETIGSIDNQEIIMISTYSPKYKDMSKVYVNSEKLKDKSVLDKYKPKDFELMLLKDEKEILEQFKSDIIEFNPQMITGWNVIDFDFKIIKQRMENLGIEFKFSKYDTEKAKLKIISDFFISSRMDVSGILVFDSINLLKINYIDFDDYKLDTVAKEVLKDQKISLNDEKEKDYVDLNVKIKQIKELFENDPKKLIEYNFKDSKLVSDILEKLKIINLIMMRSYITKTPLDKIRSPIVSLDMMYLPELHKKGIVANSNFNFSTTSSIPGGFVLEPVKNFYDDVFVFDFKSLYPSLIMTFNIDPYSFSNKGMIKAPNGAKFLLDKAILPDLIDRLYKRRNLAKKENDDITSYALKITMNSFWGAIASIKCRFYNDEIAKAITGFARYIIKTTIEYVKAKGYNVIYSDTDSVFIKFDKEFKTIDEKKQFGYKLEKQINKYFNEFVENNYKRENKLEIEFEKVYSKFFIASKKRYVGFDQIKDKLEFVGMEAIRGDWTELARDFQIKLIEYIFADKKKEDIKKFILDYIDKLQKSEFDDKLVYTKKITKPLNAYTKITPPHVKAARQIKDFSIRQVKYVMTKEGPLHISLIDDKTQYDYNHYIEKQLKGVSDDILEVYDLSFDEIIQNKNQKSLDKFF